MFEEYYGFVSSLARAKFPAHLRSKIDPEDVVQETFLKAERADGAGTNRTVKEVRVFLRKVFATTMLDHIRLFDRGRRSAALEQPLDAGLDRSSSRLEAWLAAIQTSPSQGAARNEMLSRLAEALTALPDSQRQALELRYLKGQSLEEIARAMRTTSAAAAGLVHRGIKALRVRLDS